jgi:hypothetical protein
VAPPCDWRNNPQAINAGGNPPIFRGMLFRRRRPALRDGRVLTSDCDQCAHVLSHGEGAERMQFNRLATLRRMANFFDRLADVFADSRTR